MKSKYYLKLLIITTLFFSTVFLLFYSVFSSAVTGYPLYPVILTVLISYCFTVLLFTISYFKLRPIFQKAEKNTKFHQIIYKLIHASVYISDVEKFYDVILESALSAIDNGEKGCILLMDKNTNLLNFVAAKGYDFEILKHTYLKEEQTFLYIESKGNIKETVIINDPFGYDRNNIDGENVQKLLEVDTENVQSTLSAPIFYDDKLYGMINIDSSKKHAFNNEDIEIIDLFSLEITKVLKLFSSLEKVNYYSNYDSMTGLHNRNSFNELLKENHKNAIDHHLPYSLISIDLNNLKKANDSFGHACGDALLVEFARGFTINLPKTATLARYGGDEFLLLLPDSSVEKSEEIIQKTIAQFNDHPLVYESNEVQISFCYGIAQYPDDAIIVEKLIQLSDQRMYQRKKEYHEHNI
ncbi:MAG: GGDEF domain-containing protein [Clostridia bacterium]|nr:GGDEF domain-containing protein [Clostridia bacterium]